MTGTLVAGYGPLALVFAISAVATYLWLVLLEQEEKVIGRRARALRAAVRPSRAETQELERPFASRVLAPMGRVLLRLAVRFTPGGIRARTALRLARAGVEMDIGPFLAAKFGLALGLGGLYALVAVAAAPGGPTAPPVRSPLGVAGLQTVGTFAGALALGGAGYLLPEFWLGGRARARRAAIARGLPDVLDLLTVSVEAGLGLDGAIQKVAEKFREPIAGEFRTYLKEVRLGKPRAEALRNLAARADLDAMRTFVAAVIQAEQLGISLSRVLRVQSAQMRTRRKQAAEERAMKTPVKLLFPLVFFIFPTMFIVILGPMLARYASVGVRP